LRACARRLLLDPGYYRELARLSAAPLRPDAIRFVVHDSDEREYALDSGRFDLVCSNAVLEHVGDIGAVASEIARVMAPGAVLWALIHNYYSLSGGHHLDWARPSERPRTVVPPWDHLRGNTHPAHVYLNKARPEEFREAFGRYLRVADFAGVDEHHEPGPLEGEDYLTPEVRADLVDYDNRTLLTRAYLLVAVKDASGGLGSPSAQLFTDENGDDL
jgi:SAM-dependent methyltransferase